MNICSKFVLKKYFWNTLTLIQHFYVKKTPSYKFYLILFTFVERTVFMIIASEDSLLRSRIRFLGS